MPAVIGMKREALRQRPRTDVRPVVISDVMTSERALAGRRRSKCVAERLHITIITPAGCNTGYWKEAQCTAYVPQRDSRKKMMSQGVDRMLSRLPSREAVSRRLNRSSAQRWPVPRVRATQWAVSVSISMVSGVNVAGNISVLIISFLSLSRVKKCWASISRRRTGSGTKTSLRLMRRQLLVP